MQLEYIKDDACPVCNSCTIMESKKNQRSNGQWNETREFECGAILEYSPNYQKTFFLRECPDSNDELNKSKKRDVAKASLIDFINALDVDSEYKNSVKTSVKYL